MTFNELLRIQNTCELSVLFKSSVLLHKVYESFSFPDDVTHGNIEIFLLFDVLHEVIIWKSAIDELLIDTLWFFFGVAPVQNLTCEYIMLLEWSHWSIILFRLRIVSLNRPIEDIMLLHRSDRPVIFLRF